METPRLHRSWLRALNKLKSRYDHLGDAVYTGIKEEDNTESDKTAPGTIVDHNEYERDGRNRGVLRISKERIRATLDPCTRGIQ